MWPIRTAILAGIFAISPALQVVSQASDTITWRHYTSHTPDRDVFQFEKDWADAINDAADGRLHVEIYPSGALGFKEADILGALKAGLVESSYIYAGYYSRDEPVLPLVLPQMVFSTRDEFLNVLPAVYSEYERIYDQWDIHVATMSPTVTCHIAIIGKEPYQSIDSLEGKSVRVWEAQQANTLNKLGISGVVIPQNDLYLAFQTGVVDAVIHYPEALRTLSLADVAEHFSIVQPVPVVQGIGVAKSAFNALPEDLQQLVLDVSKSHRERWGETARDCFSEEGHIEWAVEAGVNHLPDMSREDRDRMSEAAIEVWQERAEEVGPEAVEVQQRVERALRSLRAEDE